MSETDVLENPIDEIPASQQVEIEAPDDDARHGWMKAAHEEVELIRHTASLQKDPDHVYSDVSTDDKMQMKLLIDAGYKPDYENPGNSEKNRIMYYKKSRADHEMPYKAEVKQRELNERRMLKHQGESKNSKLKSDPKVNESTMDEAVSNMAQSDDEFVKYDTEMKAQFNKLIKDQDL